MLYTTYVLHRTKNRVQQKHRTHVRWWLDVLNLAFQTVLSQNSYLVVEYTTVIEIQ